MIRGWFKFGAGDETVIHRGLVRVTLYPFDPQESGVPAVLGMDLLARFRLTVSLPEDRVELEDLIG